MTSIMNPALGGGMGGGMKGGTMRPPRSLMTPGGMGGGIGGGMGPVPQGLDQQAIAADPQGFQRWMQGYQQRQAGMSGGMNSGMSGGMSGAGGAGAGPGGPAPGFAPGGFTAVGGPLVASTAASDTPPAGEQPWQMSAINPNQSLIGQQIMPGDSSSTQQAQGWAQGAGQAYNGFQFSPFQGMGPLDYGTERGMLNNAQSAMQGQNYDWSGANQQYNAAQGALDTNFANAGRQYAAGQSALDQGRAGATGRFEQGLDALQSGQATASGQYQQGLGSLQQGAQRADGLYQSAGQALGQGARTAAMAGQRATDRYDRLFDRAMDGLTVSAGGGASANTGRLNQELDAALEGLKGPDRTALAAESLKLMEERSQPGFERSLRDVAAKNAAMGRRGSGITTNELGDVTLARERELGLARRDLANQAAGQTLADRLAVSQAQQGIAGQRFGGEQFNAQLADSAAGRGLQASMATANNRLRGLDFQRGLLGDQYGIGRDAYGMARDQSQLTMERGDRARQAGLDEAGFQQGLGDRSRQAGLDTAGFQRDFGSLARQQGLDDAGYRTTVGDRMAQQGNDLSNLAMGRGDRLGGQARDNIGLRERQAGFTRSIASDLAGLTRDTYGAARDERDTARRDQYDQFGAARNRYGDFRQALGEERQNDYNRRQEARGERAFQYGLSRDAIGDDYARANFEEQLRNNRYNRGLGYAGIGFGNNNVQGAYQNQANFYGGNANDWYSLAGQLANYMGQRGRGPTTTQQGR